MRRVRIALALWLLLFAAALPAQQGPAGQPEQVADGVLLYRLDDPSLLSPAGPIAVQALRIDPRAATLEIVQAQGEPSRETVAVLASRRAGAIAAINAGFFALDTGRPTGFFKVDGEVTNGTTRARGAVGILEGRGATRLLFDRLIVRTSGRKTPEYRSHLGSSARDWARAADAIGGAGLLRLNGRDLTDWTDERIAKGFDTTRHPRTLIGTDTDGAIWLVTVDGRQPSYSLGMSFTELQRLAGRLRLRSALNLDGGGSTTMWIRGDVVNRPSDPGGPRKVGDAIVVVPRK